MQARDARLHRLGLRAEHVLAVHHAHLAVELHVVDALEVLLRGVFEERHHVGLALLAFAGLVEVDVAPVAEIHPVEGLPFRQGGLVALDEVVLARDEPALLRKAVRLHHLGHLLRRHVLPVNVDLARGVLLHRGEDRLPERRAARRVLRAPVGPHVPLADLIPRVLADLLALVLVVVEGHDLAVLRVADVALGRVALPPRVEERLHRVVGAALAVAAVDERVLQLLELRGGERRKGASGGHGRHDQDACFHILLRFLRGGILPNPRPHGKPYGEPPRPCRCETHFTNGVCSSRQLPFVV